MEIGGNKAFYEFMKEYEKERLDILKKYNSDPAKFYRKKINFTARNIPFEELAPPRNAQEAAERAAAETARVAKEGWAATSNFFSTTDEKYKIGE